MDAVPCESETVATFRDSAVGMPSTNDADVDTLKHGILKEPKEAEIQANGNVSKETGHKEPDEIIYEIRYTSLVGEHLHSRPLRRRAHDFEQPVLNQSPVMKVVDVRNTWLEPNAKEFLTNPTSDSKDATGEADKTKEKPEDDENVKLPPYESRLGSYIEIMSPAVLEALRCVVDYAPGYDLGARKLKISWPYALLVHYDDALAKYQESFKSPDCTGTGCPGQYAHKHIGIVRDFVKASIGEAVEEERKRHEKGMVTYDMLWLLFPPGIDVLYDKDIIGEYQPHVMGSMDCGVTNGAIRSYSFQIWNMSADLLHVGPANYNVLMEPFAGEMKINSLVLYPFKDRTKNRVWGEREEARQFFEQRGRTFFKLRRQSCWDFRGYTTTFPRRPIEGQVISDPDRYITSLPADSGIGFLPLAHNFETDNGLLLIDHCCSTCHKIMTSQAKPFRFSGYSNINPLNVSEMTDHQYFLCHRSTHAYVLKQRQWSELDVSGFRPVVFDKSILNTLVLEDPAVKQLIRSLTHKYLLGLEAEAAREAKFGEKNSATTDQQIAKKPWSPDFVKGKGEGLIFLLHGKPGVGKTYTAECIAANAGRPLLTITCADIGTDPVDIEDKLMQFFKYAKAWNAILLIDEADIFMEHRRVQDLERNSLVAAFLRAMEYYQGILFLTTNRVGMFDEAFISRINLTIYYPPFSDKARTEVWESFFQKLEREREGEIRVHNNTRAYVEESKELKALQWNGREIRNAFQIAVSLAETDEDRDNRGCIVIKQKHIEATVDMSRSFKKYLKDLYRKDEDAVAALRGNRNDSRPNVTASQDDEYY